MQYQVFFCYVLIKRYYFESISVSELYMFTVTVTSSPITAKHI